MRVSGDKRAVVLDQHPLWVEAMTRLLDEAGVEVVSKGTDPDEAVAAVEEFRPDVLVAGVSGGTAAEVACVRRARDAHPELKSIAMAEDADPESVEAAFAAGASIYCVKTAEREDLASAIRQAFQHSIYVAAGDRYQAGPCLAGAGDEGACKRSHASRARDPQARGRRTLELAARSDAVGHRADGEVPPVEYLSEARRRESHRGKSLGPAARAPVGDALGRRIGCRLRSVGYEVCGRKWGGGYRVSGAVAPPKPRLSKPKR